MSTVAVAARTVAMTVICACWNNFVQNHICIVIVQYIEKINAHGEAVEHFCVVVNTALHLVCGANLCLALDWCHDGGVFVILIPLLG